MYGFCKKSLRKDAPQTKEYFFPHFLLISADLEKSEDKSVHWSEVHLSEVTFYKIHILIGLMILLNLSFFHYLLTLLALCTHPRSKRLLRTSCKRRVKGALGSTGDLQAKLDLRKSRGIAGLHSGLKSILNEQLLTFIIPLIFTRKFYDIIRVPILF